MKRLPLICSVAAVAALSASLAYWGMQLFKPKQRPIAAVPVAQAPEANMDAARGLFGGNTAVAAASNYQLRGVVADTRGRGSVAIIAADNQPAKAFPVGAELAPGVSVKEVQPRFVILMEGGVQKRIELASDQGVSSGGGLLSPTGTPLGGPQEPAAVPLPQPAPPPVQMAPAQPPTVSGQPPQPQLQ
ncbi:type II secretion system protein N [Pseudoduganella violaceinigra]|uniref:type II secretion system protein N n=1 Tax=Pseudoduganella violaceinigra TaxID=246602 RepID=UPI0012B67C91|nr:type II secretion system protein N [Pseudoduganella violaceinigra]